MSDNEIRITSAQISDALPPVLDGVVHTVVNYAQMINQFYGTAYTVGPRVRGYQSDDHDIRCRSIPIPRSHPYRLMLPQTDRAFLRTIDRLPLDIVHAHSPFVSGAIAERIARKQGIPMVTTLHSKYKDDFKKYVRSEKIADMLVRRISRFYRRADDVWVPNKATGQTLREYGYDGPYHVMCNGVDFAPVDEQEKIDLSNRARELFDIPSSVHVMSFVGQQSWKKNLAFTIEALTSLARERKDFLMIFVGEGPDKRAIIDLTRKRGISSNVRFLGKLSERSHVKAVYALSDLFLFPSIYDTDSLVVKEAAACRTPSVFLAGTHAAAPIRNDDNGFIISPDPRDFAARLHSLLNQPEFMQEVGVRAMETLYRSWETVAAEVIQRYRELIEQGRKVNKTQS